MIAFPYSHYHHSEVSIGVHKYLEKRGINCKIESIFEGSTAAKIINNERFEIVIVDKNLPDFRILNATMEAIRDEKDLKVGAGTVIRLNPKRVFWKKMKMQGLVNFFYLRMMFVKLRWNAVRYSKNKADQLSAN